MSCVLQTRQVLPWFLALRLSGAAHLSWGIARLFAHSLVWVAGTIGVSGLSAGTSLSDSPDLCKSCS